MNGQLFSYLALTSKAHEFDIMDAHAISAAISLNCMVF
jgi:hypothetical protein